jgi:branched-chain amino acid aminotransferase
MELLQEFIIRKTTHSRISQVDFNHLEFGKHVSDHMLIADYYDEEWQEPQIIPFTNLSVSPTTLALHYGQSVFEGMKAFKMEDGRISIFRVDKHHERFERSLERMCMATVPKEIFVEGLQHLVNLDRQWVPSVNGGSLYIRPFVYASEARFGVKPSDEYKLIIFTGPVGPVFKRPIKVKVETEYVRAFKGGTGFAKCAGNYGGAFYPTQLAKKAGYDQVLWTDGKENKYIEESGMMNVMFVIDNTLVTPPLSDTILDGVTRDSLLILARDMSIPVEERPVTIDELHQAFRNNSITEAFGAGTAAVVAPIQTIHLYGIDHILPDYSEKNIMYQLEHKLEAIRTGLIPDVYGWNSII